MLDKAQGMESWRLRERVQAVCTAIRAKGAGAATRELVEWANDQLATPI